MFLPMPVLQAVNREVAIQTPLQILTEVLDMVSAYIFREYGKIDRIFYILLFLPSLDLVERVFFSRIQNGCFLQMDEDTLVVTEVEEVEVDTKERKQILIKGVQVLEGLFILTLLKLGLHCAIFAARESERLLWELSFRLSG